jgi:hydroxymethylbilane synthase
MVTRLQGGCQVPIACYAELIGDGRLRLRGLVADPNGERVLREEIDGAISDNTAMGTELAERLLASGADAILDALSG